MASGDTFLKWWPVMLVAGGIIGSAATAQFQINGNAAEIEDLSESVDENEDAIDDLDRAIAALQLDQKVDLEEIRGDIKMILRLMQERNP